MIRSRSKESPDSMARKEPDISLRVTNWPIYGRSRSFSISRVLFPTQDELRTWASGRFGEGRLTSVGENAWEYEREVPGPDGLWGLFTKLLGRSYD